MSSQCLPGLRSIPVRALLSLAVCVPALVLPVGTKAAPLLGAGSAHSMAVQATGRLLTWGNNSNGQLGFGKVLSTSAPVEVQIPASIASVSAATSHVLALDTDGNVWAWGTNGSGQLGDGSTTSRATPAVALRGAVQVAASADTSLALDRSGAVWHWGVYSLKTPSRVTGLPAVAQIFSALGTNAAIDRDGRVWVWGDGQNGKLGDRQSGGSALPRMLAGLPAIRHLDIGRWHVMAVDTTGAVWAWGQAFGIDGTPWERSVYLAPTPVRGLPPFTSVAVGTADNYGVGVDGVAYRWDYSPSSYSRMIGISQPVVRLSRGDYHGLALDRNGSVWGWGSNNVGQIGPSAVGDLRAVSIRGLQVKEISASDSFDAEGGSSFFVTNSGRLFALGSNTSLQLSIASGDVQMRAIPTPVPSLSSVAGVNARRESSFAWLNDGSLYAWGSNDNCQLGASSTGPCAPSPTPVRAAIAAKVTKVSYGGLSVLGLDEQGGVWSWGYYWSSLAREGDSRVPGLVTSLPRASDIARGLYHAAILASSGVVWTWGNNRVGQIGNGRYNVDDLNGSVAPGPVAGLSGVVQIGAGQSFVAALDRSGAVWAWGENDGGQFGVTTPVDRGFRVEPTPRKVPFPDIASSIEVGESALCAVLRDGSARCYGSRFGGSAGQTFRFTSSVREIAIGGYSGDTVHFRLQDGSVRSVGISTRGQLGTGSLAEAKEPQLVVNETATGYLSLNGGSSVDSTAAALPYFLNVEGQGGGLSANLTDLRAAGLSGDIFFTALLPQQSPLLACGGTTCPGAQGNAGRATALQSLAESGKEVSSGLVVRLLEASSTGVVAGVLTRGGFKQTGGSSTTPAPSAYSGDLSRSGALDVYRIQGDPLLNSNAVICMGVTVPELSGKGQVLMRPIATGTAVQGVVQCPPVQTAATIARFRSEVTGPITARTVTAVIDPLDEDRGKTRNIYSWAVAPDGRQFMQTGPNQWENMTEPMRPAATISVPVSGTHRHEVTRGLNLLGLQGTLVFIGIGQTWDEVRNQNKAGHHHTVQ